MRVLVSRAARHECSSDVGNRRLEEYGIPHGLPRRFISTKDLQSTNGMVAPLKPACLLCAEYRSVMQTFMLQLITAQDPAGTS